MGTKNSSDWVKRTVIETVKREDTDFCSSGAYVALQRHDGTIDVYKHQEQVE